MNPIANRWSAIRWGPPLLLVAAIFATYSPSLSGPFLFDDLESIVDNPSIRALWPISQACFAPRDTPTAGRPLVNLSFALNYAVGKLEVTGYRAINILIHILNALLLLAIVYQTMSQGMVEQASERTARRIAIGVAFLWSLHPLQSETVSYVTQRTELMMATFLLLTLVASRQAWAKETVVGSKRWQVLAVIACAMGMLCKEVMAVTPLLVILYDIAFLHRSPKQLVAARWPLYASLFSTWLILGWLLSSNPRGSSVGLSLEATPIQYFQVQCWAIVQYLWLAFWPSPLVGDYGAFQPMPVAHWFPRFVLLSLLGLATIVAWFRWRRVAFLASSFFLILAPTSSLIPIATEPIAERRMYLPLAAVILIALAGFAEWDKRFHWEPMRASHSANGSLSWMRFLLVGSIACLTLGYAVTAHARNQVFRSELAFWSDVTIKRPMNSRGYNYLAMAYTQANQPDLALKNFQRAIEVMPTDFSALSNLGKWYADRGEYDVAMPFFDRAISIEPRLPEPHYNRGMIFWKGNRLDDAMAAFRKAIETEPPMLDAYLALANVAYLAGRNDEAIQYYRRFLKMVPDSLDAMTNLAAALGKQGDFSEAIQLSTRVIDKDPMRGVAYHNLAAHLASVQRFDEAARILQRCVGQLPTDAAAWSKLGRFYLAQRQFEQAKVCFQRVLALNPNDLDARQALEGLPSLP